MPDTAPSPHTDLKLLLVQVRENQAVADHELASLIDITGLPKACFRQWNLPSDGDVPVHRLATFDGVIIGGSGLHSATGAEAFVAPFIDTVRHLAEHAIPTFGSCYGHQIIGRALGGEVINDPDRAETGCHEVELLEACAGDEVFGPLWDGGARRFPVLMGHNDRVSALPPGAVELARSPVCPIQAFRVAGAPMWATQFHAELTPERLIERLTRYLHIYVRGEGTLDRLREEVRPTPEARTLMLRFLDVVAGARR